MNLSEIISGVTIATAIATAVVGGVFFAFSTFVMQALTKLPPAHGLAAMQAINVSAISVLFMTLLFAPAVACLGLSIEAVWDWQRPGAGWRLAGGLTYLVCVIGMTIVFHVPRNDALAPLNSADADALAAWADYARVWTAGNHVRTLGGVLAAVLLLIGWAAGRADNLAGPS